MHLYHLQVGSLKSELVIGESQCQSERKGILEAIAIEYHRVINIVLLYSYTCSDVLFELNRSNIGQIEVTTVMLLISIQQLLYQTATDPLFNHVTPPGSSPRCYNPTFRVFGCQTGGRLQKLETFPL